MIFIGRFFPEKLGGSVIADSKNKMGMSNHNFEMSIINGLCAQDDINLRCITIPGVYSYPYNNKRFHTKRESYEYKGAAVESISFVNLPLVKEIWSILSLAAKLIRRVRLCREIKVDIIVNTPDNRLLRAVSIARFFLPRKMTQTVIIPDVPSVLTEMDAGMNPIKHFIVNAMDRIAMKMTSRSEGLVLLTEDMTDFFERPIPHVVVEGLVDLSTMDKGLEYLAGDKEVILYTGTIRKIFGVMNLVEAFRKIERQDVELWICGSGDAKEDIETAAKEDARIKFWGMVDSQEALRKQRQATILVNPRTSEGKYTRYSFPSKTMEYLLSGKSAVINRLPGIPQEYYKYVFVPENESVESLAECLVKVLDTDMATRNEISARGRDFVISKKNSVTQMRKVIDMLYSYDNESDACDLK